MKNLVSISLIAIYFFGNTEFGQVVNLTEIIKHYKFHHTVNPDVTFTKFLLMHYFGDDGNTADDNEDGKLPLKQIHPSFFICFEIPVIHSFYNNNNFVVQQKQLSCFKNPYLKSVYLSTILQPPRSIA